MVAVKVELYIEEWTEWAGEVKYQLVAVSEDGQRWIVQGDTALDAQV